MEYTLDTIKNNKFVQMIADENMKTFVVRVLQTHGNKELFNKANKVAEVFCAMLSRKKVTNEKSPGFYNCALSAAMIYNLFYTKSRVSSLLETREYLASAAEELQINENAMETVFEMVEGQLGNDTPIARLAPNPDTPAELFSWAVFFVDRFLCLE
jgi:hypothetical protein